MEEMAATGATVIRDFDSRSDDAEETATEVYLAMAKLASVGAARLGLGREARREMCATSQTKLRCAGAGTT